MIARLTFQVKPRVLGMNLQLLAIHNSSHVCSVSVTHFQHPRGTGGTRLPQDAGCKRWSLATSRVTRAQTQQSQYTCPYISLDIPCIFCIFCMRYVTDISKIKFCIVLLLRPQGWSHSPKGSADGGIKIWWLGGCASGGFQRQSSISSKSCWKVCAENRWRLNLVCSFGIEHLLYHHTTHNLCWIDIFCSTDIHEG